MTLWIERVLLGLGAAAVLTVALVYADAWYTSTRAVAAFERRIGHAAVPESVATPAGLPALLPPDEAFTSAPPVAAGTSSAPDRADDLPVALLRAPRLGLEVPVFAGTDQLTLNHGAGLVDGSAAPDAAGNTVISGHRDSFFRPLKDLAVGDRLQLVLPSGTTQQFDVQRIFVTDPLDVSVLEPTPTRRLTLITCYPFSYIGFAPERLIVLAAPIEPSRS